MKTKILLWFALLLSSAHAQTVQQSGTITAGHAVRWITNGVIGDAGTAASGSLTSVGVTNNGGQGVCVNSAVTTAVGYNQLCLSVGTATAGVITLQNYGTAAAQALQFNVNGTVISLPSSPGQQIVTVTGAYTNGNASCFQASGGVIRDCGVALGAGTQGGLAYYGSTGAISSSALTTLYGVLYGGGASAAPASTAALANNQILIGQTAAAPIAANLGDLVAVASGLSKTGTTSLTIGVTANGIANASLGQGAAATIKGNPTASLADVQDFTIQGLTALASPNANLDFVMVYDHTAGTFKKTTPGQIAASNTSGVTSLGGSTGVVTLGDGLSISGNVLTANIAVTSGLSVSGTTTRTVGITANGIANASLAQGGAATLKGNATSGTANVADFTIQGLTATAGPDANLDFLVVYDHTAGTFKKVTPGQIASVSTSGVSSLGGLTGAVTLGTGLTTSGSAIVNNGVTSFVARTGAVVAVLHDYATTLVDQTTYAVNFGGSPTGAALRTAAAKISETRVSVQDYGVVGNGVDYTTQWQAAINAICAQYYGYNGYTLYVPAGIYKITSTLHVTCALTIVGDGVLSTQLQPVSGITMISVDSFYPQNYSNFAISFQGAASDASIGISIPSDGVTRNLESRMRDIYAINCGTCFLYTLVTNFIIDGVTASSTSAAGSAFNFVTSGDSTITNSIVQGSVNVGIRCGYCGGLRVMNNKINGAAFAIYWVETVTDGDFFIQGNSFEGCGTCILINRSNAGVQFNNIIITGNECAANDYCLIIQDTFAGSGGNWTGEIIIQNNVWFSAGNGVVIDYAKDVIVGNNVFDGTNTTALQLGATVTRGVVGPNRFVAGNQNILGSNIARVTCTVATC